MCKFTVDYRYLANFTNHALIVVPQAAMNARIAVFQYCNKLGSLLREHEKTEPACTFQ
jgi:hypothetical protein